MCAGVDLLCLLWQLPLILSISWYTDNHIHLYLCDYMVLEKCYGSSLGVNMVLCQKQNKKQKKHLIAWNFIERTTKDIFSCFFNDHRTAALCIHTGVLKWRNIRKEGFIISDKLRCVVTSNLSEREENKWREFKFERGRKSEVEDKVINSLLSVSLWKSDNCFIMALIMQYQSPF